MSRRVSCALVLTGLSLLLLAATPWAVSSHILTRSIIAQLENGYGLHLSWSGRSTMAFLPVPRFKFEDIVLRSQEGDVVRGESLRAEIRILPLLAGRLEIAELTLNRAVMTGDDTLKTFFEAMKRRGSGQESSLPARRLIVNNSSLQNDLLSLDKINLVMNWPSPSSPIEMAGSVEWRGEAIDLSGRLLKPQLLAASLCSPAEWRLASSLGRITAQGEIDAARQPVFKGETSMETASLDRFSRWSGLDLPLAEAMDRFSLEGDVFTDGSGLSWPKAALFIGPNRLDGALAIRHLNGRLALSGTLAAESLSFPSFQGTFGGGEIFKSEGFFKSQLDLRLSATKLTLGRLEIKDVAANILLHDRHVEATLSRAGLHDGTLKGRLYGSSNALGFDLKTNGAFERIDSAFVLNAVGASPWLRGTVQGQFSLEASGLDTFDMLRSLGGRVSLGIRQGALVGIALGDMAQRTNISTLSFDGRGGTTPFDSLQVTLAIRNGMGELADARLSSPLLRSQFQGDIVFPDQSMALRVETQSLNAPAPPFVFKIKGPWKRPGLILDAGSLWQRSETLPSAGDTQTVAQ